MNRKLKKIKTANYFRTVYLCVCFACVLIEGLFLRGNYYQRLQIEKQEAMVEAEDIASVIQIEINDCVDTTKLLSDLYFIYGDVFLEDFNEVCAQLIQDNLAIGSMYFAPDGVIKYAYPDEVVDSTDSFNMLEDSVQGPKAQLAKDTNTVTIAGPHELIEGGTGFVIRNPIYDGDNFIGFMVLVIDSDLFWKNVQNKINADAVKYNFALWKNDGTEVVDENNYFYSVGDVIDSPSVELSFDVPNDTWYLSIESASRFGIIVEMIPNIVVSVILMGILLAVFYFMLSNSINEREKIRLAENDDIITSAGMGVWRILIQEGKKPQMRGNAMFKEILGVSNIKMTDEELYDFWYSKIDDNAIASVNKSVAEMMQGKKSENTYIWHHPSFGPRNVRCGGTAFRLEGKNDYLLRGYHYDVTEQINREINLIQISTTDDMTGMLNRRAFDQNMEQLEKQAISSDFTCITIDINGLKVVNDNLGHSAGDELIIGAARCISEAVKENGKCYRIGGDEFVILMEITKEELGDIVNEIRENSSSWQGEMVDKLSISIGIARKKEFRDLNAREILKKSDERMYLDKNAFYSKAENDRRGIR